MTKQQQKKDFIREFEDMRDIAELRALSKISLERPLNEIEFDKIMELKNKLFMSLNVKNDLHKSPTIKDNSDGNIKPSPKNGVLSTEYK